MKDEYYVMSADQATRVLVKITELILADCGFETYSYAITVER